MCKWSIYSLWGLADTCITYLTLGKCSMQVQYIRDLRKGCRKCNTFQWKLYILYRVWPHMAVLCVALHSEGRAFASHWLPQVFDFWPSFAPCKWSTGTALWREGGNRQSIGSTVSDTINYCRRRHSHLWHVDGCGRLQLQSCPLGYFSSVTASSW